MSPSAILFSRRVLRAQRTLRLSPANQVQPFPYVTSLASRKYSTPPPSTRDAGEQVIYEKLRARFPGKTLEVQDVSGGCGSFYAIEISSPAFKGLSMIKQHKLVNECLKEDIKDIHGLQLKTIAEKD